MPGPGSKRFEKALHTASGGSKNRYNQARAVQRSMEKSGKSKHSAAKAAMAAANGLSLEAALEAALSELELPQEEDPRDRSWTDTPYPTGKDPRYGDRDEEMPKNPRELGQRTAFPPSGRKY